MYLSREYVETYWSPSIGEKLGMIHYREPPPGTGHAEIDPNSDSCEVHYDKVNPHQDPLGHLKEDSPGTLAALGFGALGFVLAYDTNENISEAILAFLCSFGSVKILEWVGKRNQPKEDNWGL